MEPGRLRKALRFPDVVFFLIVAVVSPRWIASAAAVGPSAIAVWAIAFAAFFVPLGFTVLDLSRRYPEEGGIYVWTRHAFGDFAGFMTAWMYWSSNLVYFPGLLYFTAGNALYAAGPAGLALSGSPAFYVGASLIGLTLAFGLNLVGLGVGKWLHNLGSLGTWLPIAILIAAAAFLGARFGSATSFAPAALVPGGALRDLVLWSTIAFAFAGLEAASFMGEEIEDARRSLPRAVLLSGVIITATYVLGTVAVLIAVPRAEVSELQGVMQAIHRVHERAGLAFLTPVAAVLITVGSLGSVGAWLASAARLPFAVGTDGMLPPAFARLHPRWGTPYVALIVQGVGAAVLTVLGQAGTSVRGAYDALSSMAVIVYFVPYLLMFAAAIRLRGEPAPGGAPRPAARQLVAAVLGALGFLTTAGSIALALLPPEGERHPAFAVIKVAGLSALLAGVGAVLHARAQRSSRRA